MDALIPEAADQPAPSASKLADEPPLLHLIGLAIATTAVGSGIRLNGGNYSPAALALLAVAALSLLPALLRLPLGGRGNGPTRVMFTIVGILTVIQVMLVRLLETPAALPGSFPPIEVSRSAATMRIMATLAGSAALLLVSAFWAGRAGRLPGASTASRLALGAALVLHFVAMALAVYATPHPVFDFYEIQRSAAWELLSGANPYAMRLETWFPGWNSHLDPSLLDGSVPTFGFIYPPLALLQVLPAVVLGLDYRYAHALAATLTVAMVALMGRGTTPRLAAMLLATTPFGPYVVAAGWSEPGVAIWLVLAVFAACRKQRTWALGLFFAAKQYVPLFSPLAMLLVPSESRRPVALWRWALPGVVLALTVTLPLAMWDVHAFTFSTITVQLRQPFRPDALSVLALLHRMGVQNPPAILGFIALAAAQAVALWRAPRTAAGFAVAICFSLLMFFAFSKQAFANYYSLVVVAAACALATTGRDTTPLPEPAADDKTSSRITAKPKPERKKKRR